MQWELINALRLFVRVVRISPAAGLMLRAETRGAHVSHRNLQSDHFPGDCTGGGADCVRARGTCRNTEGGKEKEESVREDKLESLSAELC